MGPQISDHGPGKVSGSSRFMADPGKWIAERVQIGTTKGAK
jgi:hypothetical protein